MYETLLWNRFWETGMVEDYLRYTDSLKKNETPGDKQDVTKRQEEWYAGFSVDDRYGSESGTDRRI